MEYKREELEAMLEVVRKKIAEQGRIADARLMDKERQLEELILKLNQTR